MKMYNKLLTQKPIFLGILMLAFVFACSSNDDGGDNGGGDPAAPTIAISGETSAIAKAGETFSVDLTLNAPAGNKELVVYFNNGVLETITLDADDATSFTYNTRTVPADATEGQEFEYEFALADDLDRDSDRVAFTVGATIYDTVDVGGESLFSVDAPDDGLIVDGTSITLAKNRDYLITNRLIFQSGSSLTIEEGVTVYMKKQEDLAIDPLTGLKAEAGSSISIQGTATDPVVITSSGVLTGNAAPSDWKDFELNTVTDATLRYVRAEYAFTGFRVVKVEDANNTLEYLQSYKAGGDKGGLEFNNGSVNAKYLVSTNSAEHGFRLSGTYAGKLQFGIAVMSERVNLDDNPFQLRIRDKSTTIVSNFTVIGPGKDIAEVNGFRVNTPNTTGKVYNSIVAGFENGVQIDNKVRIADEDLATSLTVLAYSYIFDVTKASTDLRKVAETDPVPLHLDPFFGYLDGSDAFQNPFSNNVTGLTDAGMSAADQGSLPLYTPTLETIAGIGVNDFIPDATVTAKDNHDPSTVDDFFTSVTFVGAVENEAGDWTVGWVKNPDGTIR